MKGRKPMSESKILVYASRDTLETVAIFDDEYPNLNNIFKSHSILCVDLSDEEFDEILLDEESDFAQIIKNDIKVIPLKSYFDALREDKSLVLDKPRAMFFFDIPEDEAVALTSKYGVIIQSEQKIDDKVLQLHFKKNLDKGDAVAGSSNGWANLFHGVKFLPMNSLIISDNYLLQNEENGKLVGFENLKMLLDVVLPKELDAEFHLLIVSPMPQKIRPEKADQLNGMLKAYLRQIRNYDFQVEFVFNNTLHARKIISNYFLIVCDKGFQLFHPSQTNVVYSENILTLKSVLHDTPNSFGDTELAITNKDIDKIRKSCITLREQILSGIKDPTKKIIGDTTKDKQIRNRLVN
ncbi:MAG: hypothetical protein NC453_26285 [Muribaculum sp.]|nr:hypothetical protein [Muribaculum sp.]